MKIGAASHRGSVRPYNQDRFLALAPPEIRRGLDALLVVADGMGGAQAGEVASTMIIERFRATFAGSGDDTLSGADVPWEGVVEDVIVAANDAIFRAASLNPERQGMGSTVAAALVEGDRVYVANVGDSRCYLISDGQIYQITADHSWVADQVRAGLIDSVAARSHPRRNVLTRAIGPYDHVEVDSKTFELIPGDDLLLCCDGVSNVIEDGEMVEMVRRHADPVRSAEKLIEVALRRVASDNVTVVIGHYTGRERGGEG